MSSAGQRLQFFRESIGKSRDELGLILDRSGHSVGELERGKAFPRVPHLQILARDHGLNVNWLLLGEGKMFLSKEYAPESMQDSHWAQEVAEEQEAYVPGKKTLTDIVGQLQLLIPEERVLLAALKGEIDELVKEREDAMAKVMKLQSTLLEVYKKI